MKLRATVLGVLVLTASLAPLSVRADEQDYKLTIRNHCFSPAELVIPANKKVKILVDNEDVTPEEFESYELNREKVITGKGKAVIFIGPLKPGAYKYFGEFHKDTAQGIIKAE